MFADGRLPHALMLTAPAGWGVDHLAVWLARLVLGEEHPDIAPTPDDWLRPRLFGHPDAFWLEPTPPLSEKKKHEPTGRFEPLPPNFLTKVDDVRLAIDFCNGTARAGGSKVVVVRRPEMMNDAASNALLKTLEEPAGDSCVLLVAERWQHLRPTIRSRCRRMHIPALSEDDHALQEWRAHIAADLELPPGLATWLGLGPIGVLAATQAELQSYAGFVNDLGQLGAAGSSAAAEMPTRWLNKKTGLDPSQMVQLWLRLIVGVRLGKTVPAELAAPAEQIGRLPAQALLRFSEELQWAQRLLDSTSNANVGWMFAQLVTRWIELVRAPKGAFRNV